MKTCFRRIAAVTLLAGALFATRASAGDLKLTIGNGRATLIAQDVPLRQILAEWARLGQTTIVNGDKLTGPPLTLQLIDQPEREVLEVLLRSASGYIAARRPVVIANASQFDRVMILASSRGPVGVAAAPPPPFNRPNMPPQMQPQQQMPPPVVDDDEPMEPNVPPGGARVVMQPAPPFPNMPVQQPPGQTPTGQAPPVLTSPRPGMLPAPPGGQPQPYGAQPPNVRPPGAANDPDR